MIALLARLRLTVWKRTPNALRGLGMTLGVGLALMALAIGAGVLGGAEHTGDLLALVAFGWLVGWTMGPIQSGGSDFLRPEWFQMLPIETRRLTTGLFVASGAGVGSAVTVAVLASTVVYGARLGSGQVVVAVVGMVLLLPVMVLASKVVAEALGGAAKSRIVLEITSLQYGLFIAAMIVAWGFLDLLEEVDPELSGGISAPLATAVRVIPSGWGVVAVEAAGSGRWTLAIGALGGLAVLIGGGLWVWEGLLRRRVTSPRTGMAGRPRQGGRRLLPATPLGAVVGKDLRTWFRDPRRAVEVRSSLWAAVFTTAGLWILVPEVLPFAGIIVVVVGAMACVNIYAMDGTALWLTLLTPGAERADVRGRQAAWLAIFVPAALVPSALGLAVSQSAWAGPWVAAILPAILGGAAGLIPLLSVYGMVPETDAHKRSGNPAETGGDATGLYFTMFFTVPLAAGPPAALLLLAANAGESGLAWAAVAVGAVSGTVYAWWFGRLAYTRLQAQGPELLQLMRVGRRPESKPDDEATADLSWGGQALVGILVTFGMIALVPQAIIPGVMKVVGPGDPEWFIALHASQSWQWPIIAGMAGFGVLLLTGAYVIYQQGIDSTE